MHSSNKPKDMYVTVNNLKLHYLDWGNESMPAVVFLAGLSGTGHDFDPIASRLRGKYYCLSLDQRGQGDSQWADSYEASDFVSDIAGFVDTLKLDRISLVGHSLGGRTAMFYAGTYPEKMTQLVIVDIGAEIDIRLAFKEAPPPMTQGTFDSLDDFIAFQRQRYRNAQDEPLRRYAKYSTKKFLNGTLTYKHDPKLEKSRGIPKEPIVEVVPWRLLAKIKCPTLIIRGTESSAISSEVAQKMLATMSQAELAEIAGASHGIHLDKPDEFNQIVLRFFGVV
jgi:esterase